MVTIILVILKNKSWLWKLDDFEKAGNPKKASDQNEKNIIGIHVVQNHV